MRRPRDCWAADKPPGQALSRRGVSRRVVKMVTPLLTEERRNELLSMVIGAKVKEDAAEEAAQGPEETRNSVLEQ